MVRVQHPKWFQVARAAAFALVALWCAVPLLWAGLALLAPGALGDADAPALWGPRQFALLRGSLAMALGASLIAVIAGGAAGIALGYFRPRGARALLTLASLPLFVPSYLLAMAWVDVFGMQAWLQPAAMPATGPPLLSLRGHGAAAFVLGLCHAPLVMLSVTAALRRYDFRGDEAARLVAGHLATIRALVLPHVRGALFLSGALAFVLSLLNLSVPSLLQAPVYTVEIYTWFNTQASPARAILQSLPMLAAVLAFALVARTLAGPCPPRGDGVSRANLPLRRSAGARRAAAGAALAFVLLSMALPITALVVRAWPLGSILNAWQTAREELAVSLLLASACALMCVPLAALLMAPGGLLARAALAIGAAPLAVAGPVFAVGFIAFWNHVGARAVVYDSALALLFVCAGKHLGWAMLALHAAARAQPPAQLEAAAAHGASAARIFTHITLPAISPALQGAAALIFVLVFGEVDAAVLTAPPGVTPLGVRLFSLLHYGPNGLTAALGLLTLCVVLPVAALAVWRLTRGLGGQD